LKRRGAAIAAFLPQFWSDRLFQYLDQTGLFEVHAATRQGLALGNGQRRLTAWAAWLRSAPKENSLARIDYGQDAPGLMRGFLAGGVAALALTLVALWFGLWPWLVTLTAVACLYLLGMGSFMIFESRIGKVRDRDGLLASLPWRGDEAVLDVGCGLGLMLIGAALRTPQGHATGIDLWRAGDQARNSAAETLSNATAAGVSGRVTVQTADMRALPFADGTFDRVLSAWAVHNMPEAEDRSRALGEMLRVLKPGGTLAVTDIEGRGSYPATLQALGATGIRVEVRHPWKHRIIAALSFGSFAPFTVLAQKAVRG
jgi:arsenite methyltransferase